MFLFVFFRLPYAKKTFAYLLGFLTNPNPYRFPVPLNKGFQIRYESCLTLYEPKILYKGFVEGCLLNLNYALRTLQTAEFLRIKILLLSCECLIFPIIIEGETEMQKLPWNEDDREVAIMALELTIKRYRDRVKGVSYQDSIDTCYLCRFALRGQRSVKPSNNVNIDCGKCPLVVYLGDGKDGNSMRCCDDDMPKPP